MVYLPFSLNIQCISDTKPTQCTVYSYINDNKHVIRSKICSIWFLRCLKSAIFVHDKGSELLTQYLFTLESTPVLSDPCTAGSYLSSARLSTFPWSTQSRLWTQFRRVSLTEPQEIGPTTGSQSVICCHWDTIDPMRAMCECGFPIFLKLPGCVLSNAASFLMFLLFFFLESRGCV